LKDWLDPTNTGIEKMPGLSSQVLPPDADFTVSATQIDQSDTIWFYDASTGNPIMSWAWTFEGGIPPTSTDKNPMVIYPSPDTFDVTLTVTNADGEDTETRTDYIIVNEVLAPVADFMADQVEITEGESVNFTDLTQNEPVTWSWVFDGGDPYTSEEQHPQGITYELPGTYDVSLNVSNNGGSDTEVKAGYIQVNEGLAPVADFVANVTEIMIGDSVNFTDLSLNDPTMWTWTFEGGTPDNSGDKNPQGIVYNTAGLFDVTLRAKNGYGFGLTTKTDYIQVGGISIKDLNDHGGIYIYPNPTNGISYLRADMPVNNPVTLGIYNLLGELLQQQVIHLSQACLMDFSNFENGFYIVRVQSQDRQLVHKVAVHH
jgi:PKD repeat protein